MNEQELRQWITAYLSDLLDVPKEQIKGDEPLQNYGLDSADTIVIGGAMEEHFDTDIDATLFLRNDTIDELVSDLRHLGQLK